MRNFKIIIYLKSLTREIQVKTLHMIVLINSNSQILSKRFIKEASKSNFQKSIKSKNLKRKRNLIPQIKPSNKVSLITKVKMYN